MGRTPDGRGPRPGGPGRWGRLSLVAGALLGVALLVTFVWPRSDAGGAPHASEPGPVSEPPSPPQAGTGVAAAPPKPDLPETVQRYLDANVYPSDSGRLTGDQHDLLHPNARYERPRPIAESLSDEAGPVHFLLTADRYHLESGVPADATLEAWRGDVPIAREIQVLEAALVPEGCDGAEGEPAPVAFTARGDALTASLPFSRLHDHHGFVRLQVRFTVASIAEVQDEQLRFFHTPSKHVPAELLAGRFRDSVRNGSLHLEIGVDVRDPGFYRFDANVFGPGDRPVAFASFKGELGTGSQTVPLEVYGKVLRDAGIAGPYRVAQLRGYRFLDGQCPDRENLAGFDASFTTAAYPLSAFTDAPHMNDHKRRMVEMMLADHAAGIGPEWPELPPPGGDGPAPAGPDDDYEAPPPSAPVAPRGGP